MERHELQRLRDLPIEGGKVLVHGGGRKATKMAERLGIEVVRHKCLCPFHDDHHASLSFSVRRNTFRCFACGAHGGTIDLAMRLLQKDFLDACRWLSNSTSLTPATSLTPDPSPTGEGSGYAQTQQSGSGYYSTGKHSTPLSSGRGVGGEAGVVFSLSRYARFFEHPWLSDAARRFLFDERRLDERVVGWCRLSSWRDRQGVPWLQIPYFDRQGRLTGVQNRNLVGGGFPRFRFPYGAQCGIYNLPVLNRLGQGDQLWIAEGCSDCWAMLSSGHKAVAIPSATLLSRKDLEQLSALSDQRAIEFHMCPDRDEPGQRLFLRLREVLPALVHHQLPEGCKDFSDYYLSTLRKRGTSSP